MDSTPPARTRSIPPARMARTAVPTASIRTAKAINGGAGYRSGQTGQQGRHASNVAVALTRLVGAAHYHFIYGGGVQALGLLEHSVENMCGRWPNGGDGRERRQS